MCFWRLTQVTGRDALGTCSTFCSSTPRVRFGSNLPVPGGSGGRAGRSGIVKGFRTAARHRREGVHGGRRPKSLEGGNRGGSSQRRWCRSMWNLPPLLDLICGFGTGRRLSEERCAGFGRPGWDRRGDRVFGAPGFVGRRWREGCCRRSVGVAGEIATSGGSGVGGWRQGCHGHELSSPIDGIGHNRGWQPGAKVSMIIMRPPQQGQAFHSSCSRPSWAPSASSPD
jgi:hypothetical protein